ncbi:pilus assembly protein PilY [Xylophilus sp. Kf1]|nr:pilus assembly protein PilY [Xylophilus sp. Kf1]
MMVLVTGAVSFYSLGQSAPPNFKSVALSSEPLYVTTTGDKPALALALSVEYPTVGAQYVWDGTTTGGSSNNDDAYRNTKEYLGYYDAESCYSYSNSPTGIPSGQSAADYKRFDLVGNATDRKCTDAFSGNFLNWASNSAIDMLRLALSGGDRYIDAANLTILQRAVIPDGNPVCMWNSTNFPAKRLQRAGNGTAFWGAVPQAMVRAAGTGDIWVANKLDRIYFKAGASASGDCNTTYEYGLNGPTGPIESYNRVRPVSMTLCAFEGGTCTPSGSVMELWYGVGTSWRVAPITQAVGCDNDTLGDPAPGFTKACYVRSSFVSNQTPPTVANRLNTDGFFYARVSVCSVGTNAQSQTVLLDDRDYNFCTRYPSGGYKPTGVIQKYSEQMRLAAFGYLLDQTASYNNGRYGGVLRAPMKYVGQKTFDIYGQDNTPSSGNAKAEWDANTGIFRANPESDTSQTPNISGVINYLNKFGRTGVKGLYKTFDPVGELHYETLRYLQGLAPSPDAISGITPAMYDGFPVYTSWTDPYADRSNTGDYSCLKSNIIVIGDINTHDGNRTPPASTSGNIPNINGWMNTVRAFENNSAVLYTDGQNVQRTTGNPNSSNPNSPANQILGTAYWAHSHDIRGSDWTAQPAKQRPGLRVKTYTFDVNEYGAQTNDDTRRNRNQLFMAAKYGGYEADANNSGNRPFNAFGNPFKRQDGTNDNSVWQKSATPGEANTYYLQSGARGVLSAFDEIFKSATTNARSIAGGASQSTNIATAGSAMFQATFDTSDWSGDVLALPLSLNDDNTAVLVGSSSLWSAADKLGALTNPAGTRNIVVGRAGGNANPNASAFTWDAINGTPLVNDLNKPAPTASSDGRGADRLSYLRGDRSKEGSIFRSRNRLLGDVINSSVVYSGAPTASVLSTSYAGFYTARKDRTPAVFVGANDGMLHAFNATTGQPDSGKELFAYIPSWMGPRLSLLTATSYVASHQSYVDSPSVVADAKVANTNTAADWRTVLVSGTGAGGKGVFALDVSNPATFSASNVMWEFTQTDDADMGNVIGKPQILQLRTNALADATPVYGYYAVVASGVNNYVADSAGRFSSSGKPALFLLDLAKPVGSAWALNTNYFKISLPVDVTLSATRAPGISSFTAALNDLGIVSKIYAGDFHGNMWKLNFGQATRGNRDWTMEKLSSFTATAPFALYSARDSNGNVQPITAAPVLVRGSSTAVTYVAFATGKYLEAADKTSTAVNSLYAVYDSDVQITPDSTQGPEIAGRGRLKAGRVASGVVSVDSFVWGHATSDTDVARRSGWYFDFPVSGERLVSNMRFLGDFLIFGSLIPGASGGANTCGASGGSGNEYTVNIDSGDGTLRVSTVGLMGPTSVLNMPSATTYAAADNTGRQIKTIRLQVIQQGSTGIGASSPPVEVKVLAGRLSWRQINNYQDLKNATP